MLFLHGFPECWYSWRHQMAAFGQDYDVVAIDMRGYNTSDKPQVSQHVTGWLYGARAPCEPHLPACRRR